MDLVVDDLAVRRGGRLILSGLSFALGPGEAMILRGPNGAGKSTLLRCIAGLVPPDRGRVRLGGGATPEEAIAYAGHLDAVKPQLTVAENLRFWARLLGGDASHAMAGLDLGPIADQPAAACSAGQKRRLGLARLLLAHRAVWLLDEPTVSLDAATTARVAGLIRAHCDAGGAVVAATHIDLGLEGARILEIRPRPAEAATTDDPFLSESFG